jgi:hypothetical protein
MSPRLFCNVVLTWLVERCNDQDERDDLMTQIYAPMEGTDALTRTFLHNLQTAAEAS